MNIDAIKEIVSQSNGFENNIGMEFISTPEQDSCMARMHVDKRNMQPFGFLSGGATLALAETLAGVGSTALCPGCICVGLNVSGNHVHTAHEGDTVTATARIIHQGHQTHVWQVEVRNEETDTLISSISVTNFILRKQ